MMDNHPGQHAEIVDSLLAFIEQDGCNVIPAKAANVIPAKAGTVIPAKAGIQGIQQKAPDSDAFDRLALRLFAYQYTNNEPYRRFCQRRGATPRTVKRWFDIPAVPIDAFKELSLRCQPPSSAERVFMTSGTTRSEVKGRHYHPTLEIGRAHV